MKSPEQNCAYLWPPQPWLDKNSIIRPASGAQGKHHMDTGYIRFTRTGWIIEFLSNHDWGGYGCIPGSPSLSSFHVQLFTHVYEWEKDKKNLEKRQTSYRVHILLSSSSLCCYHNMQKGSISLTSANTCLYPLTFEMRSLAADETWLGKWRSTYYKAWYIQKRLIYYVIYMFTCIGSRCAYMYVDVLT